MKIIGKVKKLGKRVPHELTKKFLKIIVLKYHLLLFHVDHNKLWKILKEMGIPVPLTCLLRNLYAGQETTVRIGYRTAGWF